MYNLGMKKVEENKLNIWVEKYKYSTILTLIIFILFMALGYSKNEIDYKLYVNDNKANLNYGIYVKNNEQYIHRDDLTNIFSDNIYYDKISGKLLVTTSGSFFKKDESYSVTLDSGVYFNIKKIASALECDLIVSKEKIYVSNNQYVTGTVKYNRTEVLDKKTHSVISFVEKGDNVKIVINNNLDQANVVDIVVEKNNMSYYGYILKENVQYEILNQQEMLAQEKVVLVKAENKLMSSTDTKYVDMVAINMYRLSGVNTLTKLEYTNNVPDNIELFATINNGQTSANYDSEITTRMLNSQSNREQIIQTLVDGVEKLTGVCVDFGSLKVSDIQNFTQFIKELAAALHANGKKIIVNVPSNQYVDIANISKVADYVVVGPYMARTTSSKTSGPISSLTYVEGIIKDVLKENINSAKIILELPAYSILWTERKGTVINAERYNMQMIQEYLKANSIVSTLDNVSGQNYINYTKGITTYKMWIEDEYSVKEKTKFVTEYDLAGISIYRSGMELKSIYKNVLSGLKNVD